MGMMNLAGDCRHQGHCIGFTRAQGAQAVG
jgi:hypothetical protein